MNKVTYIVKLVRILNDPMSVVYYLVCITVVYNCQYNTSYSVQHAVVCDAGRQCCLVASDFLQLLAKLQPQN